MFRAVVPEVVGERTPSREEEKDEEGLVTPTRSALLLLRELVHLFRP